MSRTYAQAEHVRTEAEERAMQVRCCVTGCDSPEWPDREAPRCDDCDKPCCEVHLVDDSTKTKSIIWRQCPSCAELQRVGDAEQKVLDAQLLAVARIEIAAISAQFEHFTVDRLYSRLQEISIRLVAA